MTLRACGFACLLHKCGPRFNILTFDTFDTKSGFWWFCSSFEILFSPVVSVNSKEHK
jgi:hypothetical protein